MPDAPAAPGGANGTISLARLQLLSAAFLFSTGAAVIKWVEVGGAALSSLRSGVAALTLLALLPAARRRPGPRVLLVALAYAATVTLYVIANKLTTALNTIFLQSTAPLYLLLLGPWLLREPLQRRDLLLLATLGGGFALFLLAPAEVTEVASNPRLGNWLAVACGFTWALTLAGLRWLTRGGGSGDGGEGVRAVVAGNVLACVLCLAWVFPLPALGGADVISILYLGAVQIGLAYLVMLRGLAGVTAFEASLLLLLEPVLNPLWSWVVHGETPHRLALLGALVILTATVGKAWMDRRRVPPSRAALGSGGRGATRDPA